ncbi:protein RSN1 [Porphyridium purpureum]|uniref:Protein RSN1 n=1 Tax=Porphyridium purpureum TaxID=35688 RepID=A0A5J4YPI5_PORPP|nr:protein RSN1 [Porphyridium purpureum]|eukprot:POR2410..scf295_9
MAIPIDATLGWLWALIIGVPVSLVILAIWISMRPKNPRTFQFREWVHERDYRDFRNNPLYEDPNGVKYYAPENPTSWWDALKKSAFMDEEVLLRKFGLDIVMTYRAMRMLVLYFGFSMLVTAAILYPVYATGPNKDLPEDSENFVAGLAVISTSNLQEDSARFWATVVVDLIMVVAMVILVAREYRVYANYRIHYRKLKIPANYGIVLLDIPKEYRTDEKLYEVFDTVFPGQILKASVVYDMRETLKQLDEYEKNALKFEMAEWKSANKPKGNPQRPQMYPKGVMCWKPKIDAMDYYTEEMNRLRKSIEDAQNDPDKPISSAGFVVFKSRRQAAIASQVLFGTHSGEWHVSHAPDWRNVRWNNIRIPQPVANVLKANSIFWLCFFIILWAGVVTFIMGFASLTALSELKGFGWLDFLNDLPSVIVGLIETYLPVIMLLVLNMIPAIVMKILAGKERLHSGYLFNARVRNYLYVLQVFGTYFFVLVGGSILANIDILQDLTDPAQIAQLLAESAPRNGFFFITLITTSALIPMALQVSQVVRIIVAGILRKLLGKTERANGKIDLHGSSFSHGGVFIQSSIYCLICLAYSTMFPFICVVGFCFFVISYVANMYVMCYCTCNVTDDGGYLYRGFLQHLFIGMYVKLITMAGLMGLQKAIGPAVCEVIPIIIAIVSHSYLNKRYYTVWKHGSFKEFAGVTGSPEEEAKGLLSPRNGIATDEVDVVITADERMALSMNDCPDHYRKLYTHPGLKPIPEFVSKSGIMGRSKVFEDVEAGKVDKHSSSSHTPPAQDEAAGAAATHATAQNDIAALETLSDQFADVQEIDSRGAHPSTNAQPV